MTTSSAPNSLLRKLLVPRIVSGGKSQRRHRRASASPKGRAEFSNARCRIEVFEKSKTLRIRWLQRPVRQRMAKLEAKVEPVEVDVDLGVN